MLLPQKNSGQWPVNSDWQKAKIAGTLFDVEYNLKPAP
jgi:hypothetical protein